MKVIEFSPALAITDLLQTPAFQNADRQEVTFVDYEQTWRLPAILDCRNRRQSGDFIVRLNNDGASSDDGSAQTYRCHLRPTRKSTPHKKVWVIHCGCGAKILRNLYFNEDLNKLGCKVCLKLKSYQTDYVARRANRLIEKASKNDKEGQQQR